MSRFTTAENSATLRKTRRTSLKADATAGCAARADGRAGDESRIIDSPRGSEGGSCCRRMRQQLLFSFEVASAEVEVAQVLSRERDARDGCRGDDDIAAGTAIEDIDPTAADQNVVAGIAMQRVVPRAADQHVIAGAAIGG